MSKLEELIQKYCPDGVKYKRIRDEYIRLKGTPITAAQMKEIDVPDGEIRIFAGGKTVINAKATDIPNANITRVPALLVQSRGIINFIYYDKPFTFKNEMWAYTHKENTSIRFLYHVLKNSVQYFRDAASGMGSLPQISLNVTEDFVIPVPPLPVQEEIVRILDSFTQLTAELQAALQAELQARKKQYEYYRNKLLTFSENTPKFRLKEISTTFRGEYITKKDSNLGLIPVILGGQEPAYYIDKTNHEGEIVAIARSGASAGFVSYWNEPIFITDGFGYEAKTDIISCRFLFHILKNQEKELNEMKRGAGVPHVSGEALSNLKFSIPSLNEQNRIVNIIESFEALCNDISTGLPAEIDARQKQYEYYRDKLLTFKELS